MKRKSASFRETGIVRCSGTKVTSGGKTIVWLVTNIRGDDWFVFSSAPEVMKSLLMARVRDAVEISGRDEPLRVDEKTSPYAYAAAIDTVRTVENVIAIYT